MSVAKVIEISSKSSESFQDAIEKGVAKASETVSDIRGAWVKEQNVEVQGAEVTSYKVNLQVTFALKE